MPDKTCIHCGQTKDLTLFSKRSSSKDGRKSYCKKCHNLLSNKYKMVSFICPICNKIRKTKEENLSKLTEEQRNTKIYPCQKCCQIGKNELPNNENLRRKLYNSYKMSAKKRNLIFDLPREYFDSKTEENCFYCNQKPNGIYKNKRGDRTISYNGLDRIDNTKGYLQDNVVSCCKYCNRAKQDMTLEDFYEMITKIYKNVVSKQKEGVPTSDNGDALAFYQP